MNVLITYQKLFTSRGHLKNLKTQLFKRQILNCYNYIPYYRKLFLDRNLTPSNFNNFEDLSRLPVTTKRDIQQNYHDFLNRKLHHGCCFKSRSSGTTGEPLTTYFDFNSWVHKKFLTKYRSRLCCGMKLYQKMAVFVAEPADLVTAINNKTIFKFFQIRYFSIFDDFDKNISELKRFNPTNAYGFPSYFFLIAQAQRQSNISLKNLRRIFTSSEYLERNIRQYLEDTFQADVFDIYGCNEVKEIAWECPKHSGYHINEDELLCEILIDGITAAPGVPGDIVITDIRNKAMPLLRYRTNDKGLLLTGTCNCGCGFARMNIVAGRSSEYILLPNGSKVWTYELTTSVESIAGLFQYQFVQKSKTQVDVLVVLNRGKLKNVIGEIERRLDGLTQGRIDMQVIAVPHIDPEANGKFKVVKRLDSL